MGTSVPYKKYTQIRTETWLPCKTETTYVNPGIRKIVTYVVSILHGRWDKRPEYAHTTLTPFSAPAPLTGVLFEHAADAADVLDDELEHDEVHRRLANHVVLGEVALHHLSQRLEVSHLRPHGPSLQMAPYFSLSDSC